MGAGTEIEFPADPDEISGMPPMCAALALPTVVRRVENTDRRVT
jgi:hypothetical protein